MFNNKIVIFDLDGTIFEDFIEYDKEYIKSVFKNNFLILFIDLIARFFNSFDVLSNNIKMLKFRFFVYSVLGFKSYRKLLAGYKKWYIKAARFYIKENYKLFLKKLEEIGYSIIILSNNKYAAEIEDSNLCLITPKNKLGFVKLLKRLSYNNIHYFVGNNYTDDIFTANALKIKSVYLGESRLVAKKADYHVTSLQDAVDLIISENNQNIK